VSKQDESKLPEGSRTQHYIKSPQIVELPVHGAYGAIHPVTGMVSMAVFSERSPIPREIQMAPVEGKEGTFEEKRIGKEGIIRSVNAVLHFDLNTTIALYKWFGDRIKEFEEAHPDLKKAHPDLFPDTNKGVVSDE
jgi:hypothetical protein